MSFKDFKAYVQEKMQVGIDNLASTSRDLDRKVQPKIKKKLEGVKLRAAKWGKGVIAITVAGLILAGSLIACDFKKDNDTLPSQPPASSSSIGSTSQSPDIYIDSYNGENYYFCSQDYVYELAGKALKNCEKMLTAVDGVSNMGNKGFYQSFFNEDMLAAITFTESTNRIKHEDGSPLTSSTGALGMCQLEPVCIKTVNKWLRDTMTITDKEYTTEDANDPLKSLEMATLAFIRNSKNETKPSDETYKQLGVPYSEELEEKLLYAMYFYGEGNFERACQDGSIFDTYLNPKWKDANGHNYVYTVLKNKQMLISQRQNQHKDDGMGR